MLRRYTLSIIPSEKDDSAILIAEKEEALYDSGRMFSDAFKGIQQSSPCVITAYVGDNLSFNISNKFEGRSIKLSLQAYTKQYRKHGRAILKDIIKSKQILARENRCTDEGLLVFQAAVDGRKDGQSLNEIIGIIIVLPVTIASSTTTRGVLPSREWIKEITHNNTKVIDWIEQFAARVLPLKLASNKSLASSIKVLSPPTEVLPQLEQYGGRGIMEQMRGLLKKIAKQSAKIPNHLSGNKSRNDNQDDVRSEALESMEIDRHLTARTPDNVKVNEQFALAVQISTIPLLNTKSTGSAPIGGFVGMLRIDVIASGFKVLNGSIRDLDVPIAGDSAPLHFLLTAEQEGEYSILIDAYNGAAHVAGLKLSVKVGGDGAMGSYPPAKSAVVMRKPEKGEGMISISFDERDRRYCFQFCFENEECTVAFSEPMLGDKQEKLAALRGLMNSEARGLKKRSPYEARLYLRSLGKKLYRELIPMQLKRDIWNVKDSMKRLNIVSPSDTMPWEMLYITHPDTGKDEGFLADFTTVVRWFNGSDVAPAKLQRAPAYVVIPTSAPKKANLELGWVYNACGNAVLISDLDKLLALTQKGEFRWLHFAAHNETPAEELTTSFVPFGERNFELLFMEEVPLNVYMPHQPLVFMNACTTASSSPLFTEMVSWADSFIKNGAAAFVGTFWEVRDESAAKFAEAFYLALKDGKDLGQAMRDGRSALDTGDPTYLAYTLYGNPSALLQ